MKRILVGVDGSEISNSALQFAANLARATGAEVQVACSIEPPEFFGPDTTGEIVAAQYEQAVARTQATLAAASALLTQQGILVQTTAMEGPPAYALAELAKGEIDLVVVGHRSRSALARTMLGSVADRLTQICPRPVLVYR